MDKLWPRLVKFLPFTLLLFAPLFYYKLGDASLTSFDEAWYAEISRNILYTGDLFRLFFEGKGYFDHPPAGFWLMALTFKLFGISEFWARFVPATAGFLSIFVIYYLGKELFNKTVGFASAIALPSAIWFLYRSRSGNLDSILTFFFLLTLLLAIKAVKSSSRFYLNLFAVSLSLLLLTKTLVPLTIIPSLIIIFWGVKKFSYRDFILPVLIVFGLVGTWFIVQMNSHPHFLNYYFHIGLPGVKANLDLHGQILRIKEYLHSGVGKWFWPGIFAIFIGLLVRQKRFYILSVFFLTFFIPFIFSDKGQIWHLVPLFPIMILSFFGLFYITLDKVLKRKKMVITLVLATAAWVSFNQLKIIWYQFVDIPRFYSDEAILSKEAGNYPYPFLIDGDFKPDAIFYSEKSKGYFSGKLPLKTESVQQIWAEAMPEVFKNSEPLLLITYQWRLDKYDIPKDRYEILKKDRDKMLILIK